MFGSKPDSPAASKSSIQKARRLKEHGVPITAQIVEAAQTMPETRFEEDIEHPALKDMGVAPAAQLSNSLAKRAGQVDTEIRRLYSVAVRSVLQIGKLFREVREQQLHRYVMKSGSRKRYERFEDYISSIVPGGVGRTTVYRLMRIAELVEGPHALSEADVQEMPQENAFHLTKLKPAERTPEIVNRAKTTPMRTFEPEIQALVNKGLPPDQQRAVKGVFSRRWAPEVVEQIEEALHEGEFLKAIRDVDNTLSLEERIVVAMAQCFLETYKEEIQRGKDAAA